MTVQSPPDEAQPKSRNWLIIVVAVIVFCCLCSVCLALFWSLYSFGDQIFHLGYLSAFLM